MADTTESVLFNDGEGVVIDDFNDLQNYGRAITNDLILGQFARQVPATQYPVYQAVYCNPGGQAGLVVGGGSNNQIVNLAGTIFMLDTDGASIDGLTPHFHAYRIAANEINSTLTPDATNPRWVGVFVKLDLVDGPTVSRDFKDATTGVLSSTTPVKSKVVRLSSTLVHGAAAPSPGLPTTPAGYSPIAYVYVSAAHAGTFTYDDIDDWRYPIGLKSAFVDYRSLVQQTGTWTENKVTGAIVSSGTGAFQVFARAPAPNYGRIVNAVWFTSGGTFSSNPTVYTARDDLGSIVVQSNAVVSGTGVLFADCSNLSSPNGGPLWGTGNTHPLNGGTGIGGFVIGGTLTAGAWAIYGCRIDYLG